MLPLNGTMSSGFEKIAYKREGCVKWHVLCFLCFPMTGEPKKILLVEDNVDLRDLIALIITHLGYETVVVTDGEEAVERASAIQPDLILMDIGLPKLNGAEATARIKGDPETKHIPIVILTALRNCADTKRALESGAAEILLKPVSVPMLQEVLSKHLCIGVDNLMHCGFRIFYDVREVPGTGIWMGKAAVVEPADASGIERVSPIFTGNCFTAENAARDYLIAEAKKWIDRQIRHQLKNEVTN